MLRAAERGLGPEDLIKARPGRQARRVGRRRPVRPAVRAGHAAGRRGQRRRAGVARPPSTPPSWSRARCSPSRPTPTCSPASAAGSATCSSTTPSTSTRCSTACSPGSASPPRSSSSPATPTRPSSPSAAPIRGCSPTPSPTAAPSCCTRPHRMAPAVRQAVARLAARLPGAAPQRPALGDRVENARDGRPRRRPPARHRRRRGGVGRRPAAPRAPHRRRAVVGDGRARPLGRRAPRRSCSARSPRPACPVATDADELPLARQPAVRPFLELLRVAADPHLLDPDRAEMLLSSPVRRRRPAGVAPAAPRRCAGWSSRRGRRPAQRRAARRGAARSRRRRAHRARRGRGRERAPGRRAAAHRAPGRSPSTPASSRCSGWCGRQSGLEDRWVAQSRRGGTARRAGRPRPRRDRRAVPRGRALRRPAARRRRHRVRRLPCRATDRGRHARAVRAARRGRRRCSPRTRAVGREWTVVAVLGVQEGTWPDLRLRGSLLGVERLVDLLSGVDGAALSGDRRRCSPRSAGCCWSRPAGRGTRCCCRAIRGEDEQPSRFLSEIAGGRRRGGRPRRCGSAAAAARWCSPTWSGSCAARSATAPRRPSAAGARPASSPGSPRPACPARTRTSGTACRELSSDDPLRIADERIVGLTVHRGGSGAVPAALDGRAARRPGPGRAGRRSPACWCTRWRRPPRTARTRSQLRAELDRAWDAVDAGAPWFSRRERARVHAMMDTFLGWLRATRGELTQVAVEQRVRRRRCPETRAAGAGARPGRPAGGRRGRPPGGRRRQDRPVAGHARPTRRSTRSSPSTSSPRRYGAFAELGLDSEPGGARLLYVAKANRKTGARPSATRTPLDEEGLKHWTGVVADAAAAQHRPRVRGPAEPGLRPLPGPRSAARCNPSGRQVTE